MSAERVLVTNDELTAISLERIIFPDGDADLNSIAPFSAILSDR